MAAAASCCLLLQPTVALQLHAQLPQHAHWGMVLSKADGNAWNQAAHQSMRRFHAPRLFSVIYLNLHAVPSKLF